MSQVVNSVLSHQPIIKFKWLENALDPDDQGEFFGSELAWIDSVTLHISTVSLVISHIEQPWAIEYRTAVWC